MLVHSEIFRINAYNLSLRVGHAQINESGYWLDEGQSIEWFKDKLVEPQKIQPDKGNLDIL